MPLNFVVTALLGCCKPGTRTFGAAMMIEESLLQFVRRLLAYYSWLKGTKRHKRTDLARLQLAKAKRL